MTVVIDGTQGITFPNGPTALDDYEEGTFTPTIVGTTTAGTGTYSLQVGRYTKIGDRVYFDIVLIWTAHTGTGNMNIAGLPFTSASGTSSIPGVYAQNITYTGQWAGIVGSATTQLSIVTLASNAGAAAVALDTAGEVRYSGHYKV